MSRTMLKDEYWGRPRPILLKLTIYGKANLRYTVEGVFIGCVLVALSVIYLSVLVSPI